MRAATKGRVNDGAYGSSVQVIVPGCLYQVAEIKAGHYERERSIVASPWRGTAIEKIEKCGPRNAIEKRRDAVGFYEIPRIPRE